MKEFKVSPTYDCPGGVGVEDEELGLKPRDLVDGLFTLIGTGRPKSKKFNVTCSRSLVWIKFSAKERGARQEASSLR
jgi:hypothetical protein